MSRSLCSEEKIDPVGIILVSSGSRGDKLLFRYPFEQEHHSEATDNRQSSNKYALKIREDFAVTNIVPISCISNGTLVGFTDEILAHLLAAKSDLCGHKFEVKVADVVFVGYPVLLHHVASSKKEIPSMISFNVVFALSSSADQLLKECLQDLAQQLSVALKHEEKRCGFLSFQKNVMLAVHDDVATLTEDSMESPYKLMLSKSSLAKCLMAVHESLCSSGYVNLYINSWVHISFCLPHKIYKGPDGKRFRPEAIQVVLEGLKPYHGMLLLVEQTELLKSLPLDASPSLTRLVTVSTALKNLQTLSCDAELSLSHVCQLVSHLVYWGKAMVIYPLCESNIYMLTPQADTAVNSHLTEKFVRQFPGVSLQAVMSDFSLPSSLVEHRDVLGQPQQQMRQVQMVVWMLQHRLLMQLHTYVFLMSQGDEMSVLETDDGRTANMSDIASVHSDETMGTLSTKTQSQDTKFYNGLPDFHIPSSRIPAAASPEDVKLFTQLTPYFNGNHHLEEIMFYENMTRSQLITLLDKFRGLLVMCQHEDPVVTAWINRKNIEESTFVLKT